MKKRKRKRGDFLRFLAANDMDDLPDGAAVALAEEMAGLEPGAGYDILAGGCDDDDEAPR